MLHEQEVEEISLRGLARKLGVTAPALYAHVEDKRDLMAALAEIGYRELVESYSQIETTQPIEWLLAASRHYVRRALAEPAIFRVMFSFRPSDDSFGTYENESDAVSKALEMPLLMTEQGVKDGSIHPSHDPIHAAMALWTATHGVASVLLLGVSEPAITEALVDDVIGTMLAGLAAPARS